MGLIWDYSHEEFLPHKMHEKAENLSSSQSPSELWKVVLKRKSVILFTNKEDEITVISGSIFKRQTNHLNLSYSTFIPL